MNFSFAASRLSRPARAVIAAVCATPIALSILACPNNNNPGGPDLYNLAVSGAPGGSLLSVWAYAPDPDATVHAYLAGGYVGVDHAMITDGHVGRLVSYDGQGHFNTVCTTDEVLWWVTGYQEPGMSGEAAVTVYAAGEGGRVIRYHGGTCETLNVDVTYSQGLPTFWGAVALSANNVWLVGGSALPNGPKGVLVHYDGTHFTQDATVPPAAQGVNLYKIDVANGSGGSSGVGYVVGEGATILRRDMSPTNTGPWQAVLSDARTQDNRLFTVSCTQYTGSCVAVGGAGSGLVMDGVNGVWSNKSIVGSATVSDLPGLNGVWTDGTNYFFVGVDGFTMHSTRWDQGESELSYTPPSTLTSATLHGVHGAINVVFAVGGELGVTDTSQRAVILVRNQSFSQFYFDGVAYNSSGSLRTSLGGSGQ